MCAHSVCLFCDGVGHLYMYCAVGIGVYDYVCFVIFVLHLMWDLGSNKKGVFICCSVYFITNEEQDAAVENRWCSNFAKQAKRYIYIYWYSYVVFVSWNTAVY